MIPLVLAFLAPLQDPMTDADRYRIEFRASAWRPDINGRFRADRDLVGGTSISIDDDLDIDDEDTFGYFEIGVGDWLFDPGPPQRLDRVTVSFWAHEWSGETVLDSDETFEGAVFADGEAVESTFSIWNLGVDVRLAEFTGPDFDVGLSVGTRIGRMEARVSSATTEEDERASIVVVGGGFRAEWRPAPHFYARASGGLYGMFIAYLGEFDNIVYSDLQAELAASVGIRYSALSFEAGFRLVTNAYAWLDDDAFSDEDNRFNFLVGGPYVEVAFHF